MLEFDGHCGYVGINIFHVGSAFPTPAQVTSVSQLFCAGPFACLQQPFVRQLVTPQSVNLNQLNLRASVIETPAGGKQNCKHCLQLPQHLRNTRLRRIQHPRGRSVHNFRNVQSESILLREFQMRAVLGGKDWEGTAHAFQVTVMFCFLIFD